MALDDDAIPPLLGTSGLNEKFEQLYEKDMSLEGTDEIYALLLPTSGSDEKLDEPSLEDAAWADSCLIINSDLPEDSWNTMREALLETLTAQVTVSEETTMSYLDNFMESTEYTSVSDVVEALTVHSIDEVETFLVHRRENAPSSIQKADRDEDEDGDRDEDEDGDDNREDFLGSNEFVEMSENIFHVWDLETLDEEDDLIQQLNRIISESKPRSLPPLMDNHFLTQDDEMVDELTTILADLALQPGLKH